MGSVGIQNITLLDIFKVRELTNDQKKSLTRLNKNGTTQVHSAVRHNNCKVLEQYVKLGISMDIQDKKGKTVLMRACQNPNALAAKVILSSKPKLEITDTQGKNCLHYLCLNKQESSDLLALFRLLDCSTLARMVDNKGKLPVEYALINKLTTLASLIITSNDSIDIKLFYDYGIDRVVQPTDVNRYGFREVNGEKGKMFRIKKYSHSKVSQQLKRCCKWERMQQKTWENNTPKKLKERVYKGVPDAFRIRYWKRILEIEELDANLVQIFNENTKIHTRSPHDKQLDLDVNRSFQLNYKFGVRYGGSQKTLFYVLHAMTIYDPSIGYTQGMSCVPAMLTLFLDQQTTFCGYQKILTRKYRLREMFGDFEFIRKCWRVTKRILETNYPKIAQKFREMNIFDQPLPFFMFEWHYLWFIHSVKFDLALRIFDVILLEGFPALFSVANAIFHFIEQPILNETNPNILQQKLKSPFDLLNVQPTTNVFMSYMYKHQIDSGPILAYFD